MKTQISDKHKKKFTLIELMIVVAIIAIVAAIAIPNLLESRMQANEANAIGALKDYATAQSAYKRTNYGIYNSLPSKSYCPDFTKLGGPNAHLKSGGDRIALIPTIFAAASSTSSGYQGYYFTNDGNLPSNEWVYDFGLYADPCIHDSSGINTYYIDATNTIKMRDLGGTPSGGTAAITSDWVVP